MVLHFFVDELKVEETLILLVIDLAGDESFEEEVVEVMVDESVSPRFGRASRMREAWGGMGMLCFVYKCSRLVGGYVYWKKVKQQRNCWREAMRFERRSFVVV